jgi:hypothetical protein
VPAQAYPLINKKTLYATKLVYSGLKKQHRHPEAIFFRVLYDYPAFLDLQLTRKSGMARCKLVTVRW